MYFLKEREKSLFKTIVIFRLVQIAMFCISLCEMVAEKSFNCTRGWQLLGCVYFVVCYYKDENIIMKACRTKKNFQIVFSKQIIKFENQKVWDYFQHKYLCSIITVYLEQKIIVYFFNRKLLSSLRILFYACLLHRMGQYT